MKVARSPVKILASELGLPVYQPERVRSAEVIEKIAEAGAECAAVVAFGQILPQRLLDRFPLGTLNVHGSLLPKYRGAAPIQRAILGGETETGISIMLLDAGMDTGPVLAVPAPEHGPFGRTARVATARSDMILESISGGAYHCLLVGNPGGLPRLRKAAKPLTLPPSKRKNTA